MEPAGGTQGSARGSTRGRLLAAAVTVGARQGWGGVTSRAVAAEAGVRQGVVHYHFDSVESLRRRAVADVLEQLAERALEAAPGVDAVRDVVTALLVPVEDDRTVFVYEAFVAARRDEVLREQLAGAVRRFRSDLTRLLDAATADVPGRPDPAAAATVLVAAVDGLYLHRMLGADAGAAPSVAADDDRVLETLVRLVTSSSTEDGAR